MTDEITTKKVEPRNLCTSCRKRAPEPNRSHCSECLRYSRVWARHQSILREEFFSKATMLIGDMPITWEKLKELRRPDLEKMLVEAEAEASLE